MPTRLLRFLLVLTALARVNAQPGGIIPSIQHFPATRQWQLNTLTSSYRLGLNERNELQTLHWGGPLTSQDEFPAAKAPRELSSFDPSESRTPEEFPAWGGTRFLEPAVKIARADGNRDLILRYQSHTIKNDELTIELQDTRDPIRVTLTYHVYPLYGIIGKHCLIRNNTNQPLTLESLQSGTWQLPEGDHYRLTYVSGHWAAESQLQQEPLHPGSKILESRRGNTSHVHNPWFAIDDGTADETHGRVWFGALAWSGNWRLTVEQTPYQRVRITGGFNPFDFAYPLQPGESLETPVFYGGYWDKGFGGYSRLMHDFERKQILPHGAQAKPRPVLYNSWEATTFKVDEPGQVALAEKAARIGVELFVMDDGWFGARNSDKAGLGDWEVNPQKFPQGLDPLIQKVNSLGMDFGLWVEPEMVNPDSNLYRQHPDWVMNFPGRQRSELRNQLVLNLARDDVREHLYGVLDRLVSSHKIRYLKWDMNRPFAEPGWPEAGPANERKLWVQYVTNLYNIIDRLRAKHPTLEIETCSGGGGRIDLGILARTDEAWTSDNTEAFDRLRIQEGFSYAYTAQAMSAWVTDVPNMNGRSTPLTFRFLVAMQGALGIGANLNKWSDADFTLATKMIAFDKQIRATVQQGDLYRLHSPRAGTLTANQYVAANGKQSVLFAFQQSQQYNRPAPIIYLQGLAPNARYRLTSVNDKLETQPATLSGAYLMEAGLRLRFRGDYDSTAVLLEKVE